MLGSLRFAVRFKISPDSLNGRSVNDFADRSVLVFFRKNLHHDGAASRRDGVRRVDIASAVGCVNGPAALVPQFKRISSGSDGRHFFAAAKEAHALEAVLEFDFPEDAQSWVVRPAAR